MTLLMPGWLWLLLPLAAMMIYIYNSTGTLRLQKYYYYLLLSMLMLIMAMSRPVMMQKSIDVEQMGSDVIFAVDLSYSMQADDLKPTRLDTAKNILAKVVQADQKNRFGVIGFTSNAIILSPLTNDTDLLLHLFDGLDEKLIITKGTSMMPALKLARKMSHAKKPLVVLLTDGGDETSYVKEAEFAKKSGMVVNVMMLATRSGSTLKERDGSLLKDENGDIVVTSRNSAIRAINTASGGQFIEGADLTSLQDILESPSDKSYKNKTKMIQYNELFYLFVIASILLFMAATTTSLTLLKNLIFKQMARWRR